MQVSLEEELARKLKHLRVRIEIPDGDTVFLRNVPANNRFFNKARTNLLIKRPRDGSPFLVCVDEDLQYTGSDSSLVRAFNAAHRQQGWRVLLFDHDQQNAFDRVTENALKVLGSDGAEPALQPANNEVRPPLPGGLIGAFGINLTQRVDQDLAEQTIARAEQITEVIACLRQREVRIPVITGPSGVGKTNLLHGVARSLRESQMTRKLSSTDSRELSSVDPRELVSVDLGIVMAGTMFDSERENLLGTLLNEAGQSPEIILALEHVELALMGVPRGQWLLSRAADSGVKLIGTALTQVKFDSAPLHRRLCVIELAEPWPEELAEILSEHSRLIAEHYGVTIDESLFQVVIETADQLAGHLPAKAIALLDSSASRAALSQQSAVSSDNIHQSASSFRLAETERKVNAKRS
jgi:ATP-dependent Clp protease ATP-binding subunit ClpA